MPDQPPITPWPAPKSAPVLLFGGSFDPPHRAHAELSVAIRDRQLGADAWLVVVPAARSPHKPTGPLASNEDRIAMLGLAFDGVPRVAVWTDEIDRAASGAPSYWADTLERAAAVRGGLGGVRFLIGADQVVSFHRWHRARDILELCEPLVVARGEVASADDADARLAALGAWSEGDRADWRARFVETSIRDESSTRVRDESALDDLSPAVGAFIAQRGLYAGRRDDR